MGGRQGFNIMSEWQIVDTVIGGSVVFWCRRGRGRRLVHHGLLRWLRVLSRGCVHGRLCANGVETPHAHVGVPFPVKLA